jgi:hypothetical protein
VESKAHHSRRPHLHGGEADLAISLDEMRITGREQGTLLENWKEQLRSTGQVLNIEVAAVLARRNGAKAVKAAGACRNNPSRVGRACHAALVDHALFTLGPLNELLRGRGDC